MPATSDKQKHFMIMVKAYKAGHELKGISKGTRAAIREAAGSMSEKQVSDFADAPVKKKKSLLAR